MSQINGEPSGLTGVLGEQDGVVDTTSALGWMSREELRWRVTSGRWQRPCYGVLVAHSGPLTHSQRLWIAAFWAGPGAVLAGLTAAGLDGLEGFSGRDGADQPVHLLVPANRSIRRKPPGLSVVVHYSTMLAAADVHPLRKPRRTRVARSLVDAAAWMATDRGAQAVLAAGVQQRLVRVADLTAVVARNQRLPRRAVIRETLDDIAGGAQALSELDFTRLIRRHRLPEPDRQSERRDPAGRRRWLDAVWEAARLVVEVDGIHHLDAMQYWADMDRANDVTLDGYRVLRFPAFVVRYHPSYVAGKIRQALGLADRDPCLTWTRYAEPPGAESRAVSSGRQACSSEMWRRLMAMGTVKGRSRLGVEPEVRGLCYACLCHQLGQFSRPADACYRRTGEDMS